MSVGDDPRVSEAHGAFLLAQKSILLALQKGPQFLETPVSIDYNIEQVAFSIGVSG